MRLELEDDAAAGAEDPVDLLAERPVAVPGDVLDVLEELAGVDAALKVVLGEEVVVAAVLLAGTALAGRRRDGHGEVVALGDEVPDQRALAGAGRSGDDEEPWPHVSGGGVRPAPRAGGRRARPRSSTG